MKGEITSTQYPVTCCFNNYEATRLTDESLATSTGKLISKLNKLQSMGLAFEPLIFMSGKVELAGKVTTIENGTYIRVSYDVRSGYSDGKSNVLRYNGQEVEVIKYQTHYFIGF